MQSLTSVLRNGVARFALACVVAFGVSTSVFAQSNLVNVQISLTVDNYYALFAVDPNTNQLTLIGSETSDPPRGDAWKTVETYSFTAPFGSYIYVVGRDIGAVAMFVSRTVFDNSVTVLTGIPNPFAEWEVNTIYRLYPEENFPITDPNRVLNWGGGWQAPAVGRFVDQRETNSLPSFRNVDGARFIWAPPGGGNRDAGTLDQWGFEGDAGRGTALFRLQVVVPEPASLMALGAGLAGLIRLRRRKR
jgi:hypothetical protein